MKAVRSFLLVTVLLLTSFASISIFHFEDAEAGDVYLGGEVTGTWDSSNVYHITSPAYVPIGAMLNITQGTKVLFGVGATTYKFEVFGTLNIVGTAANPVYFSSEKPSPAAGDYPGIHVDGGSATIKHAIIEFADVAVTVTSGTANLEYCIIRKNNEAVIEDGTSTASLLGCEIHDNIISGVTLDSTSRMDFINSRLNTTGTAAGYPAILQRSSTQFYGTNSTIENNFTFAIDTSGSSTAVLLNCTINSAPNNFRFIGTTSMVTIKNYLHIYVATESQGGDLPLSSASVMVFEDQNLVESRETDPSGQTMWMEITYAVFDGTTNYYPVINISINYAQIFTATRSYVNMFTSHWENFINRVPEFHFASEYSIDEDGKDEYFIDLWEVVEDDYDLDQDLRISITLNTGLDINGKKIAEIEILNHRYLSVDVSTGSDNDNWTGQICFQINVSDQLGMVMGIYNISEIIWVNVTQVNDPPMWFDISTFHVNEDQNFLDAINVLEFVYDDLSLPDDLEFSVKDFDKFNYDINIDLDLNLDIVSKFNNLTGFTNLTLCAEDPGGLFGNFSTRVVVDPVKDPPAVVRKFSDLTMDEDTIYSHPVSLNQVFFDSDGDKLYFSFDSDDQIDVQIESETGNVSFTPKQDWFGKKTLSFYANDTVSYTLTEIEVSVNDINDPPGVPDIILPGENELWVYKENEPITFSAYAYDPDIDLPGLDIQYIVDSLSYIWRRNTSSDVMSNQANFTTSGLPEGYHEINITVTDSRGLKSSATLDMLVLGEFKIPEVLHRRPLPEDFTTVSNVRLEWNVSADNSSLEYIRYDVLLDITDPPENVAAEKIKSTSFTVKDLVKGTKYYWSIIPYVSTKKGIDKSGVWSFTYCDGCPRIYDVEMEVDKKEVSIYPGNEGSINITLTNKGNMPDLYRITITVEPLIKDMPSWTFKFVKGNGNGIYGMQSNEIEELLLTISVPEGFEMYGDYEIGILVESDSFDESEEELVGLVILEMPEPPPVKDAGKENNLLRYLLMIIIIIVVAVIIVLFVINIRKKDEEEKDDEGENEDQERAEPNVTGLPPDEPVDEKRSLAAYGMITTAKDPETLPSSSEKSHPKESETEENSDDEDTVPESVSCGSCGASIEISTNVRPLNVTCKECENGFTLKG